MQLQHGHVEDGRGEAVIDVRRHHLVQGPGPSPVRLRILIIYDGGDPFHDLRVDEISDVLPRLVVLHGFEDPLQKLRAVLDVAVLEKSHDPGCVPVPWLALVRIVAFQLPAESRSERRGYAMEAFRLDLGAAVHAVAVSVVDIEQDALTAFRAIRLNERHERRHGIYGYQCH